MKAMMLKVIERALVGADDLPPAERADLYDGIAELIRNNGAFAEDEWAAAVNVARALREAEGRQLTFAALIRVATNSPGSAGAEAVGRPLPIHSNVGPAACAAPGTPSPTTTTP